MKFQENVVLLTAKSVPYDFAGNSGVSHRIRLSINNEIFVCKSTPEQVIAMKPFEGKEGDAILVFSSPKESISLTLESFVPKN